MKIEYPCVFGCLSLKGPIGGPVGEHLKGLPKVKPVFSDTDNRCRIYLSGDSDEINYREIDNGIHVMLGRCYKPIGVGPRDRGLEQLLPYLDSGRHSEIDGNYVHVGFTGSADGKPKLSLTTDKYGSRLVLYFQKEEMLYFSTHLHGLGALLQGVFPGMSKESLIHFYHFGQTPNDRTLYEGILKVPPGSTLEAGGGTAAVKKYFRLVDLYDPAPYIGISEPELIGSINRIMKDSLVARLATSRKVGITLSGGVDSGYIAKLLRDLGVEFTGYNLAYKDKYDEYERLDGLSRDLGVEVSKVVVGPEEIVQSYADASRCSSEPIAFNDATLRRLFLEGSNHGVDTMLEGGGADHLFFGMYRSLLYYKTWNIYRKLSYTGLTGLLARLLARSWNPEHRKLSVLLRNWRQGIPPYPKRLMGEVGAYDSERELRIYKLGIERFWKEFVSEFDSDDMRLYFTFQNIGMDPEEHFYPPSELQLPLGMFPISPYWDSDLVSLALSMPMDWKTKNGASKYILRKAAAESQPDEYWMLPKIGLASTYNYLKQTPQGREWIEEQHRNIVESREYGIIRESLGTEAVNCDRLVNLFAWKAAAPIGEDNNS